MKGMLLTVDELVDLRLEKFIKDYVAYTGNSRNRLCEMELDLLRKWAREDVKGGWSPTP